MCAWVKFCRCGFQAGTKVSTAKRQGEAVGATEPVRDVIDLGGTTSEPRDRNSARMSGERARRFVRRLRATIAAATAKAPVLWASVWRRTGPSRERLAALAVVGAATAGRFGQRLGAASLGVLRRIRPRHLVAATVFAVASIVAVLAYSVATLPLNGGLVVAPTPSALVIEADGGANFATRGVFKGSKLSAADLPDHLKAAVVAIEDRRFYEHGGVDLRGIARAAWRNWQGGGTREGGSTITQQLARLMFLSPDQNMRRKIQEALLALWLERQIGKDEILLRYLNTAYFGAGAYGVDAAARRYFDKATKDLSLAESAMLAGLVRAPSQLAPTRNLGGAKERAATVLAAMLANGTITAQQAGEARVEPVNLRIPPETPPGTNYFADMVAADARRLVGGASGDLKLRTTLDLELQKVAEGVVARRLDVDGAAKNVSQVALVAIAPDGAIKALVGGRDYEASQFNRATQARRQPGSLFKLFVYLAAMPKGYTPQSIVVDEPTQIGDWEPQNAGGRFKGRVPLRTAFAQSINSVAAQLGDEVGIPAVIAMAKRFGVRSELPAVPSLALGSAEVTLLEMTRAYAVVATGNESIEPHVIRSIQGEGQQALFTRSGAAANPPAGLGESRAMMLDLLQAVVREGTGRNARLAHAPAAGKTGTTQDYRDAWFIGFTPELTVGIWVGNDDNSSMDKVVGGGLPAEIFRDFLTQAVPALAKGKAQSAGAPVARAGAPGPVAGLPADLPAAGVPQVAGTLGPPGARASTRDIVRGVPEVLDTGTLAISGARIRLEGVASESGTLARQLARFLRRREVVCAAVATPDLQRCEIDGENLSEIIIAAGGARATTDAPAELLAAEDQARSARLGIWRRQR
jgi:1A family penicillin-binding protein